MKGFVALSKNSMLSEIDGIGVSRSLMMVDAICVKDLFSWLMIERQS